MTFRLKLLLSMVLLVLGSTATTLFITESQVRRSYERHFQQSFRFQVDSFLQQREARLEPIQERVAAAAASPRLFAAMENAGQDQPEQQDVDDLYQNGLDQLWDSLATAPKGYRDNSKGFYFFLNNQGTVLYPSAQVKLPFSLLGLRPIAQQVEAVGKSVSDASQIGYLALETEPGSMGIREMVFTPLLDPVSQEKLGVLAVGLPLPGAVQGGSILSALWLNNRLDSSSIPGANSKAVEQAVGAELRRGAAPHRDFTLRLGDVPYQVYCQLLSTGPAFPPAYQVCLYSLADAVAEEGRFTRQILASALAAALGALVLSWLIARSLAVPLQELVTSTTQIERGNYMAKVTVRSHDELGRLGQAFNAMAERIHATYAALEQRIAERTHELAERRRAEAALRQSEASLREAQRIAHLGNWEWDIPVNQLRWSEEARSIFGLVFQPSGATVDAFLERVHPADRERVEQALRESLATGKPCNLEHRVVHPDGEERIVRQQTEVLRDGSGRAIRMVGTVQDLTEQKRIEAEALRAQRMDGIGAIAGGMAHDLNNALAPILMGIQRIRQKVAEPEIRQMLGVMESNTHRGADMVRQVLTFVRGHDGEAELLEPTRLLREIENVLRQTMPASITLQTLIPTDLWPVFGNATQLHQALLNLCVNARDAMPKGGQLTLAADNLELSPEEAKHTPGARPGAYVMLLVSDTGTGISPEVLPRIFDAFFTTKAPGKGTGLGLPTTARIVRNHKGFLNVKSEVGAGSTFELYLPRAEPAATTGEPLVEPSVLRRGHGELILFIDNDRSVREMVVPALTEQGYWVITAANGAEGLALLGQHEQEARLVLTDIAMPVMDGLEMTRKLRSRFPDLPVIVMSGALEAASAKPPSAATGILRKPFRLEQLLKTIAEALGSRPSTAAAASI
jgi:two-component system, cell cycle sensor histidine kinase and response regulator CckA